PSCKVGQLIAGPNLPPFSLGLIMRLPQPAGIDSS
ncbi:MAG: hypothetical protein ACI90M_003969, partial [Candidatus Azotimanducaceae bacterium]